MYKDKEGHDREYLGANKSEKCTKLHLDKEIGIELCPESCEIVDQCLAVAAAGGVTDDGEGMTTAYGVSSWKRRC